MGGPVTTQISPISYIFVFPLPANRYMHTLLEVEVRDELRVAFLMIVLSISFKLLLQTSLHPSQIQVLLLLPFHGLPRAL